jgi:hypothetical protein
LDSIVNGFVRVRAGRGILKREPMQGVMLSIGLQDTHYDGCSAHMTKAARRGRNVSVQTGSGAQKVPSSSRKACLPRRSNDTFWQERSLRD